MAKLKTLDLFTGIAGFTLALGSVANVLAYCDNHIGSRATLSDLMRKGRIPTAPIIDDVKHVRKQKAFVGVDVITAGFPCQDVSTMNIHGEGIYGTRSGLIFEVIRICKELSPKILILENSPNLQNRGLDVILKELQSIGFTNIKWSIFSARNVGAPHTRKRLYLLASKKTEAAKSALKILYESLSLGHHSPIRTACRNTWWKLVRPPARVVPKTTSSLIKLQRRGYLLGNAVVPQAARVAICILSTPEKSFTELRCNDIPQTFFPINLHVPSNKVVKPRGASRYTFNHWSTPLSTKWTPSKIGTNRTAFHLPNQILYEKDTRMYMRHSGKEDVDDWIVNPEFVEWLMGFPTGWTVAAACVYFPTGSSARYKLVE